jgi:DNA-3-methyladenine glycosylase II
MKLEVLPTPPFSFELTTYILRGGESPLRKIKDGSYIRLLHVNDKHILTEISSVGTVEEPRIIVKLRSQQDLSSNDAKEAKKIVSASFNLELDVLPFYDSVKNDTVMSIVVKKLRGLRSPTTPTVYEALVESIIEQQISLNVAHRLEASVIETFGESIRYDDEVIFAFPLPGQLAEASINDLKKCQLSQRKSEYIRDISKLIVSGELDLEKFNSYKDTSEIVKELDEIRGVGPWTAEMTVLRGLRRFDAFPADDVGMRRHMARYYTDEEMITSEEARAIADKWGEWKGLAAFYLIVADSFGVDVESIKK